MAWRIDQQVINGELDCRTRGKVIGAIWLVGRDAPLSLSLTGCPWRDLAGCVLRFTHSSPEPKLLESLSYDQTGAVGDITASRKVRVPDGNLDEIIKSKAAAKNWPSHFKNALYLEWYSEANGRVVIESTDYELEMEGEPVWTMTVEEEQKQREENRKAIQVFLNRLSDGVFLKNLQDEAVDDEEPTSRIEAEADEESARMDLLLDRVNTRMNREGVKPENLEWIMEEERTRLRRENREPEPEPLTWDQQQEQDNRVREMNKIFVKAEEEYNDHPEDFQRKPSPLAKACLDLGGRLHRETCDHGWIPESSSQEHPLHEICLGVRFAAAKLAGALHRGPGEDWPPDPLFAGDTLVRLKKARAFLRDALSGLNSADEENLATPEWRTQSRIDIQHILSQVQTLIYQVRTHLE